MSLFQVDSLVVILVALLAGCSGGEIVDIVGYRKKTVTANLKLVFPNKSEKEISLIKKKFYKHMCDMFLEMIKSITISEAQLNKRFIIKNILISCVGEFATFSA